MNTTISADEFRTIVEGVEALTAKLLSVIAERDAMRAAIEQHNAAARESCARIDCGPAYRHGGASCHECPRRWMIDLPQVKGG